MENGKLILALPNKSVGAKTGYNGAKLDVTVVKRVKWDIFRGKTESSEIKWDMLGQNGM